MGRVGDGGFVTTPQQVCGIRPKFHFLLRVGVCTRQLGSSCRSVQLLHERPCSRLFFVVPQVTVIEIEWMLLPHKLQQDRPDIQSIFWTKMAVLKDPFARVTQKCPLKFGDSVFSLLT